jgi:hypothetical protein
MFSGILFPKVISILKKDFKEGIIRPVGIWSRGYNPQRVWSWAEILRPDLFENTLCFGSHSQRRAYPGNVSMTIWEQRSKGSGDDLMKTDSGKIQRIYVTRRFIVQPGGAGSSVTKCVHHRSDYFSLLHLIMHNQRHLKVIILCKERVPEI